MTATVTVKARAWPATVSLNGQDTEVAARSEHSFHVEDSATFSVKVNPPAEADQPAATENPRPFEGEPVPGAAENDALLGKKPSRFEKPAPSPTVEG